jgi:hypothetical protein
MTSHHTRNGMWEVNDGMYPNDKRVSLHRSLITAMLAALRYFSKK